MPRSRESIRPDLHPGGPVPLRVLILEDNPWDAKLMGEELKREGYALQIEVTDSPQTFQQLLTHAEYDVILSDFSLRGWNAFAALDLLIESGKDIPFIVVTGSLGDEGAVECIKRGAADFVLKDQPARLPTAVQRALQERKLRDERRRADSERQQAEDRLRDSESRFRLLFAANPLPMWVYDLETLRFLEVNEAAPALYGYSRQEFLQMRIADIRPPEDIPLLKRDLARPRTTLEESGPWRHQLKDGRIIQVMITSHTTDWNGRSAVLVVAQDVTARLGAEQALRESEERYRLLFEHNLAGVLRKVLDGQVSDCNRAMAAMLGYGSPEEVLGHPGIDLYYSPEERSGFLSELLVAGWLSNYELRLRRKDGSPLWVIANVSTRTLPPSNSLVIEGTFIDISQRKQAEQRLREYERAVEGLEEIVLVLDREYRYVLANRAFLKYRMLEGRQVTGQRMTDFMDLESFERQVKPRLDECFGGKSVQFEIRVPYPNLGDRDMLVSYFPIEGHSGIERVTCILRDITERKQAEVELARLAAIVSSSDDPIYSTETDGTIITWNAAAERLYGYSAEEIKGKHFTTLISAERRPEALAARDRLFRGESIIHYEFEHRRKDGVKLQLSLTLSPIKNAAGEVTGVSVIVRDITARQQAEEALRESEERFRTIGETIQEVFWNATPDLGRILYVSPGYEHLWGRSVASLYENPRSFLEAIHGEDRERVLTMLDSMKEGKPFDREYRIIRPDGSMRWISDRGFPVRNPAGEVICYAGVARDTTDSKVAEAERARLATAIEQAAEGVLITDLQGTIEYINPALCRITGYTREETLGRNARILKSGKQDLTFYQHLWQTILSGETWRGEVINRRKNGTLYTELMTITPVRNSQGNLTHFIATKQDVTEARAMEAQLHQAAKMEAVGQLAGGVAHDFNNLLTVINGYAELLMETTAPEHPMTPPLREIKNAGERAASLTRQLLAFSRRQVLEPQVLNLNGVVSNLEKMLRRLIGEHIKLRTVLDPTLGRVKADPGQIEQVIMNLAVNARDAMPTGGNLTIETANVELDETHAQTHATVKPGPHVMLAVSDTGTGMTVETQARIFEPFFTTKGLGKGTGLGLSTVYGIVKQSGGSIWVYSELGQGTVFKVYLPTVSEAPSVAKTVMTEASLHTGTETILVVEDAEGVRSLVRSALASCGYKVLEAEDGEKALELSETYDGPIHLMLSDIVMPSMSGWLLAEKFKPLRPDMKVLFMSGYTDDAIFQHGELTPDTPFIQKPFIPGALRKKIREVLSQPG